LSEVGKLPRVEVLGTPVSVSTFEAALGMIAAMVGRRAGEYVSCANAYSLSLALDDPAYRQTLAGAAAVSADGMSVVWALRALGHPCERVHNDDLFLAACELRRPWRHFLVGGREGQPEAVASALAMRVPGIQVVGMRATPRRPVPRDEHASIVAAIREARPDIAWVGMGTPAQDEWMREAAPATGVPMVGVGSAFDLLAGRTSAAPEWMKRSGLQWLFRLAQEPRRLARRYLYHNSRFATAFARQYARHVRQR
jgi:N-acetylglucosaminyldiphosphoundecaprenol N-acetyl-beta-D-mannosaminyltransferase